MLTLVRELIAGGVVCGVCTHSTHQTYSVLGWLCDSLSHVLLVGWWGSELLCWVRHGDAGFVPRPCQLHHRPCHDEASPPLME